MYYVNNKRELNMINSIRESFNNNGLAKVLTVSTIFGAAMLGGVGLLENPDTVLKAATVGGLIGGSSGLISYLPNMALNALNKFYPETPSGP